jgi:ribosomal protein S18 acetylase RimI-like enzyme
VEPPDPGMYWKIPFIWEPGCPLPVTTEGATALHFVKAEGATALHFVQAEAEWLRQALAKAMASSLDESDRVAVQRAGAVGAADELLAICPALFAHADEWWRVAVDSMDRPVGFVLPAIMRDRSRWKDGQPQGTIVYIAVMPDCRGRGHSHLLLAEATRVLVAAGCGCILCDTAATNAPMIQTFRKAGYLEKPPWQRPL